MSPSAEDGAASRLRSVYDAHGEKLRFLVVGGWNTVFSYAILWVLDLLLRGAVHYAVIVTLGWVIGITQNLFTFKLLVFRTKGNWLREYLRSYVVYAGAYVLNLGVVTAIMELFHPSDLAVSLGSVSFVIPKLMVAAFPALVVVTIVSYFGHKNFTYGRPREEGA